MPAHRNPDDRTAGHGPHRHRAPGRRRRGRGVASLSVALIGALLSATVVVTSGWFWYNYRALDAGLHRVAVTGLGAGPDPRSDAPQQVDGKTQNILLIGNDSRAGLTRRQERELKVGRDTGSTSTDSILIIHVPADGRNATLISIPRDSYVDIPGHPKSKINAAFADGYYYTAGAKSDDERTAAGLSTLIATLKGLTGLQIDHYVMVSFLGFYNIAKTIHGISVDLCHAVDDTRAYNEAHGQGAVGSGFTMSAGHHDLTPIQSLEFVRQRHNLRGGDLAREARQRYFLAAAFDQIVSADTLLSPGRLRGIIDAIRSTLTIDPELSLPALADQLLDLTAGHIRGQTIPTEGSRTFPAPVGAAELVDPVKVRTRIQQWLAAPAPAATSDEPRSESASGSTSSRPAKGKSVEAAAPKGCID